MFIYVSHTCLTWSISPFSAYAFNSARYVSGPGSIPASFITVRIFAAFSISLYINSKKIKQITIILPNVTGIGSLSPEPMGGLKLVQVLKMMPLRRFLISHIHPQRKDVSILSTTQVLKLEGERG